MISRDTTWDVFTQVMHQQTWGTVTPEGRILSEVRFVYRSVANAAEQIRKQCSATAVKLEKEQRVLNEQLMR
jgi:hypothetical protein